MTEARPPSTVDVVIVGAGFAGHVHAASPARSRHVGPRVRGGQRRRRHLVLEPLSRRALRRREHAVLLLVLAGAAAGMAVERAVRLAAGDPALRQPRRRPVRPAARHPVRHAGDRRRASTRRRIAGTVRTDRGDRRLGAALRDGDRLPVHRARAGFPGLERFSGKTYHTGHWPHEGVDFTGKRVGVIGTGSSAIQAIPVIAQQAAHVTVFQRTPNFSIPSRNGPMTDTYAESWKSDYPTHREKARHMRTGILNNPNDVSALETAGRGAAAHLRGALGRRRHQLHGRVQRPDPRSRRPTTPPPNSCATRSARWCATRRPRNCWRRRTIRSAPSASASIPTTTTTYNRDNVTLVDARTTPISEITATWPARRRHRVRVRRHRVRHRLRCDDRRADEHRHRGRRRDAAAEMGGRADAPISA